MVIHVSSLCIESQNKAFTVGKMQRPMQLRGSNGSARLSSQLRRHVVWVLAAPEELRVAAAHASSWHRWH